jgi:hypothetical protein
MLLKSRLVHWKSRNNWLYRIQMGSRLWTSISTVGWLIEANLEMAGSLVIFHFLRNHTSNSTWVSFVIKVNLLDSLEIVGHLWLISLLKGKIMSSQMLRSFSVISKVGSSLCLWYELFFCFWDIINRRLIPKLDIGSSQAHSGIGSLPKEARILAWLTDSLLVSGLYLITLIQITNIKANCLHFAANFMGKLLWQSWYTRVMIYKSVFGSWLIVKLFIAEMEMSAS